MKALNFSGHDNYVLLSLSDYLCLEKQAHSEPEISLDNLIFLSAVVRTISPKAEGKVILTSNAITLRVISDKGMIVSTFSADICAKYYNRIHKFIEEVL